jgi:hypothetical protein
MALEFSICEVEWDRYRRVSQNPQAREWLNFSGGTRSGRHQVFISCLAKSGDSKGPHAVDDGRLGCNAKSAATSVPKATRSGSTRLVPRTHHSLHLDLSAPPTASQPSVPGVVRETHDVL